MKIEDQPDNIYYEDERKFREREFSVSNPNTRDEYSPQELAVLLETGGSIHGLYALIDASPGIYAFAMTSPLIRSDIEDIAVNNAYQQDLADVFEIALNSLTKTQRKDIVEYYYNDRTQEDIADDREVSHQAVQQSLAEGISNLRKLIKYFVTEPVIPIAETTVDETSTSSSEESTLTERKSPYLINQAFLEEIVSQFPLEQQAIIYKGLSITSSPERIAKMMGIPAQDLIKTTAKSRVFIWDQFGRFNKDYSTWRLKRFINIIPTTAIGEYTRYKDLLSVTSNALQAFEIFMGVNRDHLMSVEATAYEMGITETEEVREYIEAVLIELEEVKIKYLKGYYRT